jgi:hypothetical protein
VSGSLPLRDRSLLDEYYQGAFQGEIPGSRINFHDRPYLKIPIYEKAVTLNQIASTRDVFSGGRRGAAIIKNCAHEQEAFSTIDYGALCPA